MVDNKVIDLPHRVKRVFVGMPHAVHRVNIQTKSTMLFGKEEEEEEEEESQKKKERGYSGVELYVQYVHGKQVNTFTSIGSRQVTANECTDSKTPKEDGCQDGSLPGIFAH